MDDREHRLSSTSDREDLPPRSGATVLRPLLQAESTGAAWRVVEAFSVTGLPFELALAWSSAGGSGAGARLTVAHAARVCVFARSLRVRVGNLADAVNRVGVTVANAFALTENQWEAAGELVDQGPAGVVEVPPFARRVRVELSAPALASSTTLTVIDGQGVARAVLSAQDQPPDGLLVGGARTLQITSTGATSWRAVFTLSL